MPGPLQYINISAGDVQEEDDLQASIEDLENLKKEENFSQLSSNNIAEDSWQFGSILGQVGTGEPLNLGFVKVNDFGLKVSGKVGSLKIPYGFFKYQDQSADISDSNDAKSESKRNLEVFAKDITLEMGQISKAIAPIAQGINKFTENAKGPLNDLTKSVTIFNKLPVYGRIDIRSDVINFVKDFEGNPRKDYSDVLVVELIDKFISLASPNSFSAMTPVVLKAQEFVDNIQTIASAAGSAATSIPLPDLSYSLNANKEEPEDEFNQTSAGDNITLSASNLKDQYGLPTMTPKDGEEKPSSSTTNSMYANLNFPVFNNIGGLLKNIFLTPEEKFEIASVDLGLKLGANTKGETSSYPFSVNYKVDTSLDMKTKVGAFISMNDIYKTVEEPENMISNFGNMLIKGASMDLNETKLEVKAGISVGAGVNLMPRGCFGICWPGVGASVSLGVKGDMKVSPTLYGLDNKKADNQDLTLADLLSSSSARELFRPSFKSRTTANENSGTTKDVKVSRDDIDGLQGSIKARLIDYKAIAAVDLSGYEGEINSKTSDPQHLQLKVSLEQPIYLNLQTLDTSTLKGEPGSSVKIDSTGWLYARSSILTDYKKFTNRANPLYNYYQVFDFSNAHYLSQIRDNIKQSVFDQVKEESPIGQKIRENIELITNRTLAIAKPKDAEIALSAPNSTYIETGIAPADRSIESVVYANKVKIDVGKAPLTLTPDKEQYLSFMKNFNAANKEQVPSISFGFKPKQADIQSNLSASFEVLTEEANLLEDFIVEVVDKNLEPVAELGTLATLTNNKIESSAPDKFLPLDSSDTNKVQWDQIITPLNTQSNATATVTKVEKVATNASAGELSQYITSIQIINPSQLTSLQKESLPTIINPAKFYSGEYGFRIKNQQKQPSFTGLSNFWIEPGKAAQEAQDTAEITEAHVIIDDFSLVSAEAYDSFEKLLKHTWQNRRIRTPLLGGMMANVPSRNDNWNDFYDAVKETYSSVVYERKLSATPSKEGHELNGNQSIKLALSGDINDQLIDISTEKDQKVIGHHPRYRSSIPYDLKLDIDTNIYITIDGNIRFFFGEKDLNIATFPISTGRETINLGRVNRGQDAEKRLRSDFTSMGNKNNSKNILFQHASHKEVDPKDEIETPTLYSILSGVHIKSKHHVHEDQEQFISLPDTFDNMTGLDQKATYAVNQNAFKKLYSEAKQKGLFYDLLINEISTLYSTQALPNNTAIAKVAASRSQVKQLLKASFKNSDDARYFDLEKSSENIYSKIRNSKKNALRGIITRYQFNVVMNSLQTIMTTLIQEYSLISTNSLKKSATSIEEIVDSENLEVTSSVDVSVEEHQAIDAMNWAYNSFLGYLQLIHDGSFKNTKKQVAQKVAGQLGNKVKEYPRIDFSNQDFLRAFLVYSEALISDHVNGKNVNTLTENSSKAVKLLSSQSIAILSQNLSKYNAELANTMGYLSLNTDTDSAFFAALGGLKEVQQNAIEHLIKIYRLSENERNLAKQERLSNALLDLYDKNQSVNLNERTKLNNNQIRVEPNYALSLRKHHNAFIDVMIDVDPSEYGLMVPITFDTPLEYGEDKDFFVDGFKTRPPAYLDFEDFRNKITLKIRLGANAEKINNQPLTIHAEQPFGQVLPTSSPESTTYNINKGDIISLNPDLTPIVLRENGDGEIRISSAYNRSSNEAYGVDPNDLNSLPRQTLGLASFHGQEKMNTPISEFTKIGEDASVFGYNYYTADADEIAELIQSDDYLLTNKNLFYASSNPGNGYRPVYKYVHQNDKYKAYWSLKPNEQKDSYLPAEIAWYSLNEPSEYLPAHSQILKGKMIGDYHLAIQGVSKNRHSLTSYIDLRHHSRTQLNLNTRNISGIIDLDGFSENHRLTLINKRKKYIPVDYKGNSIVIDDLHTIRFWDTGEKAPDAGIANPETDHPSKDKGSPIIYLSPSSVDVLNIHAKQEVKLFTEINSGKPIYTSSARKSLSMHEKPSQYQFDGVAFIAPTLPDENTENIYIFENKASGEFRYASIDKEPKLSDRNFVREPEPVFQASTKPADGLEAVHQINHQNSDQIFLVFENDPLYQKAENEKGWKRIDSIFYAKPSAFGFNWSSSNNHLNNAQIVDSLTKHEKPQKNRIDKKNPLMPSATTEDDPIINHQNSSRLNGLNEFSLEDGISQQEEMALLNQIIAAQGEHQDQDIEGSDSLSRLIQDNSPLI